MKDRTKLILLSIALISLVISYFNVNKRIEEAKIPKVVLLEYQNENGILSEGYYDLSRKACKDVYDTYTELNQKIPLKALRECLLIGVG